MSTATAQSDRPSEAASAGGAVRAFLILQAATFVVAAALHFGALVPGFAHPAAAIAESVIGSVLLAGLVAAWVRPRAIRGIGLVAQGFALAGTLVGLFTIAIGIGPRTLPDLIIHAVMVIELVWGLVVTRRVRVAPATSSA